MKPYGAVAKRCGFQFIADAKYVDRECRLIEFEFNVEQTYILEFGHNYIRFYMDGGQIEDGGSPYEISSTYTEDELLDIKFFGVSDILFITNVNHPAAMLTRSGHTSWTLSDISFTNSPAEWTTGNYPICGAFHEERTVWAGCPSKPGKIWFSKTNDPYNMTVGAEADDGFDYDLRVNPIRWIASSRRLVIGTAGGEWWLAGDAGGAALEPTIVQSKQDSANGCYHLAPVTIGANLVFVQRPGKVLRSLGYNFESDGYKGIDLSVLAEHITRQSAIKDMAYQQYPDSIVWMILEDGNLVGATYSEEHKVIGWHTHPTREIDFYESVACIKGSSYDEIWVSVKRYINGNYKRTIEQAQNDDWSFTYRNTIYEGFTPGITNDVILLLQSDKVNGSQMFVDTSANPKIIEYSPIVFSGRTYPMHADIFYNYGSNNIKTSPSEAKFGQTALCMGGYSDASNCSRLKLTNKLSDFDFIRSSFTIDFWAILEICTVHKALPIITQWDSGIGRNWALMYYSEGISAASQIRFRVWDTPGDAIAYDEYATFYITAYQDKWTHVAITCDGTNLRFFLDGTQIKITNISSLIPASTVATAPVYVGGYGTNPFSGSCLERCPLYLDEFRIKKGVCAWTSDFTPPTEPTQGIDSWDSITTTKTKISDDAFYVDSGLKYKDEQVITGITSSNPPVVTIAGHGWSDGQTVHIREVLGTTAVNNESYTIANITTNTFELSGIDGAEWGTYIGGGIAQREVSTVVGLDHLNGEEVAIFANGKAYPKKKVLGGSVSIEDTAPVIIVGIPIDTKIKTLRLSSMAGESTMQTKIKRINKITPRMFESLEGEIGEDEDSLVPIPYQENTDLFTGDKEVFYDGTYNPDAQILISHNEPTPFTLLALTMDVDMEND